jgi:hypothetical protein
MIVTVPLQFTIVKSNLFALGCRRTRVVQPQVNRVVLIS